MRKILDGLYHLSGFLAGLLVVFIFLIILAQIVGRRFGVVIPSANELSGFAMAGAVFLALAPTLRAGAHIRVGVLVRRLQGKARRRLELGVGGFSLLASSYAALQLWRLVLDSYRYGDLAPGLLPLPIWIPQSLLAVGISIFVVALADTLVALWRGEFPSYLAEGGGRSSRGTHADCAFSGFAAAGLAGQRGLDRPGALGGGLGGVAVLYQHPPGASVASSLWGSVSSWSLAALPMFIWMGEILYRTRLAADLFEGFPPGCAGFQAACCTSTCWPRVFLQR